MAKVIITRRTIEPFTLHPDEDLDLERVQQLRYAQRVAIDYHITIDTPHALGLFVRVARDPVAGKFPIYKTPHENYKGLADLADSLEEADTKARLLAFKAAENHFPAKYVGITSIIERSEEFPPKKIAPEIA